MMKISKNVSLGLLIAGAVLLVVAVLEHFLVTIELLPHLGIYLVVLALILGGVGGYGLMGANRQG